MPCPFDAVDEIEVSVALTMIHHEGTNASGIAPEREDHHIHHQLEIRFMILGNANFRTFERFEEARRLCRALLLSIGKIEPPLNRSDRFEILIDPGLIRKTDATFETPGMFHHKINDTAIPQPTLSATEHPIEDDSRLNIPRYGCRGIRP